MGSDKIPLPSSRPAIPVSFSIKDHIYKLAQENKARHDLYEKVMRTNFDWVVDLNYEIGKTHLRQMIFRAEKSLWAELGKGGVKSDSIQSTIDKLNFVMDQYLGKQDEVFRLKARLTELEHTINELRNNR